MFPNNFHNDPFFQPFGGQFGQNPFGMLEHPGMPRGQPGAPGGQQNRGHNQAMARHNDMFMDPFAHMNRMMEEMSRGFGGGMMMPNMNHMTSLGGPGGNNGQSYSYSSVMSYSNNGGSGEPKYFEATSSTRQGPGGVKETRKTVRDSESGLNKMAVGHHINDRGHVVERSMNRRTNQRDEHQNFIGMDEADAGRFNEEWSRATVNLGNHPQIRGIENGGGRNRPRNPRENRRDHNAIDN